MRSTSLLVSVFAAVSAAILVSSLGNYAQDNYYEREKSNVLPQNIVTTPRHAECLGLTAKEVLDMMGPPTLITAPMKHAGWPAALQNADEVWSYAKGPACGFEMPMKDKKCFGQFCISWDSDAFWASIQK